MKKIAWVTDSTACLDEELTKHPDVYIVPMTIVLDEKEYKDGIDLTAEELYEKLKHLQVPPKTSQPSVGEFVSLFEKLEGEYDHVFSVLVSAKLSGTVSSSVQAAEMVKIPVTTIDSKILSYPLSRMIKKGMEWTEAGNSVEELNQKLCELANTNETFVLIGSLEQLHRSGRMNGLSFFLGSMLNIKPIISIEDGVLQAKEKIRSESKGMEKIISYLQASIENYDTKEAYILYGLHDKEARKWHDELCERFPDVTFGIYPLGATIGVHAGENTIGISWFNRL
ncbi:DegV family protein [Robertmurraya korlensis]|uniref:DegV family protein n=1 Tax=Robertmurraya korlensis TaxID=519977 RepID=UPI00203A964E|nr:DegV family protein [Robertmurraya korlensis]MCM3599876.1 DegV family protein [Robertmurraya korlensis]